MSLTCVLCNQPITALEAVNTHNPSQVEHATRRDCIRATARRCAEIADYVGTHIVPINERCKGSIATCEGISDSIREEFRLEPRP